MAIFTRKKNTVNLGLALAATMWCCSFPVSFARQSQQDLPFQTVLKDDNSGVEAEKQRLITTKREWRALWKKVHSLGSPVPDLPQVDFSTHMIVAVFKGETGPNHSLEITRIVMSEESLQVFVKETIMDGPNCLPLPAIVNRPFQIVELERLGRRLRRVAEFKVESETRDCEQRGVTPAYSGAGEGSFTSTPST